MTIWNPIVKYIQFLFIAILLVEFTKKDWAQTQNSMNETILRIYLIGVSGF